MNKVLCLEYSTGKPQNVPAVAKKETLAFEKFIQNKILENFWALKVVNDWKNSKFHWQCCLHTDDISQAIYSNVLLIWAPGWNLQLKLNFRIWAPKQSMFCQQSSYSLNENGEAKHAVEIPLQMLKVQPFIVAIILILVGKTMK